MAKVKEPLADTEMGGLPPELQVGGQLSNETSPIVDKPNDNPGDNDEEAEHASLANSLPAGQMSVVVTKGNTVRHDGYDYSESRTFSLSVEDAKRLIGLGVAADVDALRNQALVRAAPSVSVQSGE